MFWAIERRSPEELNTYSGRLTRPICASAYEITVSEGGEAAHRQPQTLQTGRHGMAHPPHMRRGADRQRQ
jgi:hypothetical protein